MKLKAYLGSGNYIFVSYSHKDSDRVFELIEILQKEYNVWFDEGIRFGREWDEEIVSKIDGCSLFVYAITKNSLESKNCKDEIAYAKDSNIPFLNMVIDDIELPNLFKLRYGRFQMLKYYEYHDKNEILEDLKRRSEIIAITKKDSIENEETPAPLKVEKKIEVDEDTYIAKNYALFDFEKEITIFPIYGDEKNNVINNGQYINDSGSLIYRIVMLPTDSVNAPVNRVLVQSLSLVDAKDKVYASLKTNKDIDAQYSSNVLNRGYNCINIDVLTDKDIPYLYNKCQKMYITLRIESIFNVYFDVEYQILMNGKNDTTNNPDTQIIPELVTFNIHHSNYKILKRGIKE